MEVRNLSSRLENKYIRKHEQCGGGHASLRGGDRRGGGGGAS